MRLKSGLYSGTITARSASAPSPASSITYTVAINEFGQSVTFAGVSPQASSRWSSYIPSDGETVNLIPFEVGRMVSVHIIRLGSSVQATINDAEFPEFGPCDGAAP